MTLITTLNKMNVNILTEDKATQTAAELNASAEVGEAYKVEKLDHGYAVAIYEDGLFILYL